MRYFTGLGFVFVSLILLILGQKVQPMKHYRLYDYLFVLYAAVQVFKRRSLPSETLRNEEIGSVSVYRHLTVTAGKGDDGSLGPREAVREQKGQESQEEEREFQTNLDERLTLDSEQPKNTSEPAWTEVSWKDVVPGEIIRVSPGMAIEGDLELLKGHAWVVHDYDSVYSRPILKIGRLVSSTDDHTLRCGSVVVHSSEDAVAGVTGLRADTLLGRASVGQLNSLAHYPLYQMTLVAMSLLPWATLLVVLGWSLLDRGGIGGWLHAMFAFYKVIPILFIPLQQYSLLRFVNSRSKGMDIRNPHKLLQAAEVEVCLLEAESTLASNGPVLLGIHPVQHDTFSHFVTPTESLASIPSLLTDGLALCHR